MSHQCLESMFFWCLSDAIPDLYIRSQFRLGGESYFMGLFTTNINDVLLAHYTAIKLSKDYIIIIFVHSRKTYCSRGMEWWEHTYCAQSPGFKPQYHQKPTKQKDWVCETLGSILSTTVAGISNWDTQHWGSLAGGNVLLCRHRLSGLVSKGWALKTKGSHLLYPCKQVTEAKSKV
jgi:hypothetical protein